MLSGRDAAWLGRCRNAPTGLTSCPTERFSPARAPGFCMDKDYLVLKRASASRPSGEGNDDDFDVLAVGVVVGRILKVHAAPVGSPWMSRLAFGQHEHRTPTHGY